MLLLRACVITLLITTTILLSLFSVTSVVEAAATVTSFSNLFMTVTTVLSGDLDDCATPADITATDCKGGLASADAYIRNYTNVTNEPSLFSWTLDRGSPFVQMHPLDWGVNRFALQTIFNYSHFRTTHSIFASTTRNFTYLQNDNFPVLLSNVLIPPSNVWLAFGKNVFFDDDTKIALISIRTDAPSNAFNELQSVAGALELVSRRTDGPWYPVVLYETEVMTTFDRFVSFATDTTNSVKMKPAAIVSTFKAISGSTREVNETWISGFDGNDDEEIYHIRFGKHPSKNSLFSSLEQVISDITELPQSLKDSYYVEKQQALKTEANKAAANDPVVGQSGKMPFTRSGNFRMCYRGECELGNLWTDALRWKANADIGLEGSGGIRGPGWEAGDVKISDIFNALPFQNTLCTGKVSGITLFKIFNHSVSQASFTSTFAEGAGQLLQVSGARVTYNTNLPKTNRLIKVEILNRDTNKYEPLERLKIYSFATNSFTCTAYDPYPDLFNSAVVEGEQKGTLSDDLVQEAVADYFRSLSAPYDTALEGRLVNDTSSNTVSAEAAALQSFVQDLQSCPVNTIWRNSIKTCVACNPGFVNPTPQDTEAACVPAPEETNLLPIILGIAIPLALLILAAVIYYFYRKDKMMRENVRDLENAPKNAETPIGIIFTDIQGSTALWSTAPLSMSAALETHNKIINEIIAVHEGYYVKSAGDSFFIAYDCTRDGGAATAAKICVEIQRQILEATYPAAINQIYNAEDEFELLDVVDDPNIVDHYPGDGAIWNGLRVRIGLAIGTCQVKFDEVAKSYDYFGPLVNLAARTEASGIGGQILVCEESTSYFDHKALDCTLTSAGRFELKGIPDPVHLMQLMPTFLEKRNEHFAFLRAQKVEMAKAALIAEEESEDGGESGGDQPSYGLGLNREGSGGSSNSNSHSNSQTLGFSAFVGAEGELSMDGENNNNNSVNQARDDAIFLQAALRTIKPKDKQTILNLLESGWGLKQNVNIEGIKNEEERLMNLANKVSTMKYLMILQAQRKKEQREARRDGSNTNKSRSQSRRASEVNPINTTVNVLPPTAGTALADVFHRGSVHRSFAGRVPTSKTATASRKNQQQQEQQPQQQLALPSIPPHEASRTQRRPSSTAAPSDSNNSISSPILGMSNINDNDNNNNNHHNNNNQHQMASDENTFAISFNSSFKKSGSVIASRFNDQKNGDDQHQPQQQQRRSFVHPVTGVRNDINTNHHHISPKSNTQTASCLTSPGISMTSVPDVVGSGSAVVANASLSTAPPIERQATSNPLRMPQQDRHHHNHVHAGYEDTVFEEDAVN